MKTYKLHFLNSTLIFNLLQIFFSITATTAAENLTHDGNNSGLGVLEKGRAIQYQIREGRGLDHTGSLGFALSLPILGVHQVKAGTCHDVMCTLKLEVFWLLEAERSVSVAVEVWTRVGAVMVGRSGYLWNVLLEVEMVGGREEKGKKLLVRFLYFLV